MSTPTEYPSTFDGLLRLAAHLRGPDGCPWDREQSRRSMRRYILEECYELLQAIDADDNAEVVEELGDVMFHLAFQVQLGREQGAFDEGQVFATVIDKLVGRHPHVFGESTASDAGEVLARWQSLKRSENDTPEASIMDGVPAEMPALSYAQSVQERASGVGFDWEDVRGVLAKVDEEVREIEEAVSAEERDAELGDLLFSIVNFSRWLGVDAESALRGADDRFKRRFALMERLGRERGVALEDVPLADKEALWQQAKRLLGEAATGQPTSS